MSDKNITNATETVIHNPWRALRQFTDARIGLGHTGVSLPTHELLAFQLAHAQAKDAVHEPLKQEKLLDAMAAQQSQDMPIFKLHSQAFDRFNYLQRPDLGRRLDATSLMQLQDFQHQNHMAFDLAIVVVDGLSSTAVQNNAVPFIAQLKKDLSNHPQLHNLKMAPLCLVEQGRVAIGDEVGKSLNALTVMVLIGERPGLSSPDSLGLYLTWQPKVGLNDAHRNCISNIRPAGLSFTEASQKALYLIQESRRLQLSGVNLKDRSHEKNITHDTDNQNFLIE